MNYAHLKRNVQTTQRQPVPPAPQMKGFVDCRPEFAAQRKLINGIQNSSGVAQCSLKIGENVYDIEKGKYRVNGKEVKDYQLVIAEIKKNVEATTKEKTEAGEKKYKWDDNWNNIVADFVKCEKVVEFSNIGKFIDKIEATIIEDSTKLDSVLKELSKIDVSKKGAIQDAKQEQISAVEMEKMLNEIILLESKLEIERQKLDEVIKNKQLEIQCIENKLGEIKKPIVSLSPSGDVGKPEESVKVEAAKQNLEKPSIKDELGLVLNSFVADRQKLDEKINELIVEKTRIASYQQEKSLYIPASSETGGDSNIYWNNIDTCRKIIKKYPPQFFPENKRRLLFEVEIKLAEKSPEMNDKLFPPTRQKMDTTMCWFLSVFEGLRRAKLVCPIIERLIDDPDSKSIFCGFSGLQDWQLLLERKFMDYNGLLPLNSQILRPSIGKNNIEDKQIMAAFFNGTDPKFPGVLAGYKYLLEQDISLHIVSNPTDLGTALKSLPEKGGVQMDKVTGEISFYTVDKPGHAMFYLGRSPYGEGKDVKGGKTGEEKVVNQKIKEKEAELLLINKGQSTKINDLINYKNMGKNEMIAEKKRLKDLAMAKLSNELDEIKKIPITGYYVKVYNQSHQAKETYRLGLIARIQKHTFTLNKKATSTK